MAIVSLANAPRNLQGLLNLTRSVRMRLAFQGNFLRTSEEEAAFSSTDDDTQVLMLLGMLKRSDSRNRLEEIRERALAKLTDEEVMALGLERKA